MAGYQEADAEQDTLEELCGCHTTPTKCTLIMMRLFNNRYHIMLTVDVIKARSINGQMMHEHGVDINFLKYT